MRTLILKRAWRAFGPKPFARQSRGVSLMIALLLAAANVFAAPTVNWISGGPNTGYSSGAGYVDGDITADAEYHTPCGIAFDITGQYLFVADRDNNAIRMLDFAANWTWTFNITATNLINKPIGVAVDTAYNVYVLNRGTGANGSVVTFDNWGDVVLTNATKLTNAAGMALASSGDIYVTVRSNTLIRITGTNQTVVATITNKGTSLQGVAAKHNGLIAVCDSGRNGIYLINPGTGIVTTNAGFHGVGDFTTNGNNVASASTAKFNQPMGVAEAGDGTLVVTDNSNHRVKRVLNNGVVTNLYGVNLAKWVSPYKGFMDGTVVVPDQTGGVAARLPYGVALAPDGSVYVTEDYYHIIRHVTGASLPLPPPAAPGAPTDLTATANYGQVILTWSASVNATNYYIKRSTSSGGPTYTTIAATAGTSYTDTNVINGTTYYYVVSAVNIGGESPNSAEVSATPPVPPPPAPRIGWYDYEGNWISGFFTKLHPVSVYVANNDLLIAVDPNTNGVSTYYISGPTPLAGDPSLTNGSSPRDYQDGWPPEVPPLQVTTVPDLTIKAVNVNYTNISSPVVTARFIFQTANPTITGNNAARFAISDVTSNVVYWYTIDGSDPTNTISTNNTSIGPIVTTNGNPAMLSLNGSTNILFKVRAFRNGYYPSGIAVQTFTPGTFVPNSISFGFDSGEASSDFVASPGQLFYAPVTLSPLSDTVIYSLQFNLTVTNAGPNPGPAITPGEFYFQTMLYKPDPENGGMYLPLYPYMFAHWYTNPIPPAQYVYYEGTNFVDLVTKNTSLNLLGVGWLERYGATNLYDTKAQDLIAYSFAHDNIFLQSGGKVILGGFNFQVPTTATNGQTYQIQIGRPSATLDGIGTPGSSVFIFAPTNGSLGGGAINSIKNVTMGQRKYLVGNAYPFRWFNAGDFGNTNLQNADVEQVVEAAIYGISYPPYGSDFFDVMDSCGNIGTWDGQNGYFTNNFDYPYPFYYSLTTSITNYDINTNVLASTNYVFNFGRLIYIDTTYFAVIYTNNIAVFPNATNITLATNGYPFPNPYVPNLFDGDDANINEIAFGDGRLDVCDVYVTYRRSLDPSLTWYQRFWEGGQRVAETVPNIYRSAAVIKSKTVLKKTAATSINVTNLPKVVFTAGDIQATAGSTISIPITASVFGDYPLRMLMLNLRVVPLDGSPALTTPVSFSYNAALGSPWTTDQRGNGNYSAVWLNDTISGLSNNVVIGTLYVTIPANATSSSAYAVHFDHVSASPNGLGSFPKSVRTGLITLSNRSSSSYGDGIPDSWRLRYFLTMNNYLSAANADADGDGLNNLQECATGTDPSDSASFFKYIGTDLSAAQSSQDCVISWPSVIGKQYVIERSPSLSTPTWTAVGTNSGNGTTMEYHDATGGGIRYYRVRVQ
jgi:hypothetical protein